MAREKGVAYGEGLIVNIPSPVDEVALAVQDVATNGIIRGTKEYAKDEYVGKAEPAKSSSVFSPWTDPGKVFYKVRRQVLAPWNFKDSADVGTLAVRYIVQPQGEKNTILRIDALFVEDYRHGVHQSDGSVESSEYKDIQDHLAAIELIKKETADALSRKQRGLTGDEGESSSRDQAESSSSTEVLGTPTMADEALSTQANSAPDAQPSEMADFGSDPNETPEQRLAELKRQVERVVKNPGAPLKSAPFHSASTLKSLDPGTEVLIVILSPYWLGVETHEGDHGWIRRDELENLP